ncbi:unnamed protein product [Rotaria socialis]|uniref:Carbohydrate sulfotransferase n=1 Tax=Rotaria socialis TaxID=392032 RepID=A0A817XTJ4_9BILA|nr:unnamed protein product [Rotaria socialis]CAF3372646.1 unnamed protein product [Rotaria socialis]CAF3626680.1 unnamed protein product [Rotaria socialis]CAF3656393.1 unnamed protein product [Rotaria socialis]CAF4332322.1 unnamed protein product [Rotaria socialis]
MSLLWLPNVYEERSASLIAHCMRLQLTTGEKQYEESVHHVRQKRKPLYLIFVIRTKRFAYCSVPKVATKTVLGSVTYAHLRELREHLSSNRSNVDFTRVPPEKLIHIRAVSRILGKHSIFIGNTTKSPTVIDLIDSLLSLLRLDGINVKPFPPSFDIWHFYETSVFPYINLEFLSNASRLLSSPFTRAIFVRHPFERLAAAYTEKIATLEKDRIRSESYYNQMRQSICLQYFKFNGFLDLSEKNRLCENIIPSFQHFIASFLQNHIILGDIDPHWQPYSSLCSVCNLRYNLIGKYETFDKDYPYFLKLLNLSDWDSQRRRGSTHRTNKDYKQLYVNLPDEMICRLRNLYSDDLQIFNYRLEDYIDRPMLKCSSDSLKK